MLGFGVLCVPSKMGWECGWCVCQSLTHPRTHTQHSVLHAKLRSNPPDYRGKKGGETTREGLGEHSQNCSLLAASPPLE